MADQFDMTSHLEMWHDFTRLLFFGAAGVVAVLVLLALFFL